MRSFVVFRMLLLPTVVLALIGFLPSRATGSSGQILFAPTGAGSGDQFGDSVSTAGDFNGDGYDDLVVGAPFNSTAGSGAGAAYIFFGGPSADDVPDLILTGEADGDHFGSSVASGDFDGDGASDVIVGAPDNDFAGLNAGRAYLYLGDPGADNLPDLVLTGESTNDHFGSALSSAGHFSSHLYMDIIVGAANSSAAGPAAGRAYLYFGGLSDDVADLILTGEQDGDYFGVSVASAGTFNLDGFDDVIVGAPGNDAGGFIAGRAYIYYGGPGGDAIVDLALTSPSSLDNFGTSVSSAGDFNGDGAGDVIVGASHINFGSGRAFLYLGGAGADALPDFTFNGEFGTSQFGASVAAAGDVNGDTFADVIVGVPGTIGFGTGGYASIFFGGPSADAIADITVTGEEGAEAFGTSVAGAGDVNGDGFDDFVVGAPFNDLAGPNAGRAYVFTIDLPTPTLISFFEAHVLGEGIALRWKLSESSLPLTIGLERAERVDGPWMKVAGQPRIREGMHEVLDEDIEAGRTYHYRLVGRAPGGEEQVLGSLEADAPPIVAVISLRVSPNPAPSFPTIDYSIVREAPLRLSLFDVGGREIAVLANGLHAPGRYQTVGSPIEARAGIYFVRLRALGRQVVRRIVVAK